MVRHMEGELACEELKTQCTCKKMAYVPSPHFGFYRFVVFWRMPS